MDGSSELRAEWLSSDNFLMDTVDEWMMNR